MRDDGGLYKYLQTATPLEMRREVLNANMRTIGKG